MLYSFASNLITDVSQHIATAPVTLILVISYGYSKIRQICEKWKFRSSSSAIDDVRVERKSWQTLKLLLIFSLISWLHSFYSNKLNLSTIYDSNGKVISYINTPSVPFLMDTDENCNSRELKSRSVVEGDMTSMEWALVTGASSGIGKAIAIELARWNVPVILVGRNLYNLNNISRHIEKCYKIRTQVIQVDLSQQNAAELLFHQTNSKSLNVSMLVLSAGIAETADLVDTSLHAIEDIVNVNILSTTKLMKLYGEVMKQQRKGRILVISSLTGVMPGIPTSSVYAASKAFQKSITTSIRRELERFGIGVTTIMPGGVKETGFAANSNMSDSLVWSFPIGTLKPQDVASSSVKAMITGQHEVIVGWLNVIMGRGLHALLPDRIMTLICELSWRPSPLRPFRKTEKIAHVNQDL